MRCATDHVYPAAVARDRDVLERQCTRLLRRKTMLDFLRMPVSVQRRCLRTGSFGILPGSRHILIFLTTCLTKSGHLSAHPTDPVGLRCGLPEAWSFGSSRHMNDFEGGSRRISPSYQQRPLQQTGADLQNTTMSQQPS
ncbi:hypothetical protein KC344_g189 [Hortaea werneckii]|nr:hypothetical protein KC344_g189 [Hortaea werneckii]